MDTDSSLRASFWLMVILQTLGSVDLPGYGERKMPAPRAYVPIVIAWAGLQLAADAGMERGARTASWVLVLVGLVIGPFGKKLVGFLTNIANQYGPSVASGVTATSSPTSPTPQV